MEASKQAGERTLMEKKEKVMLELQKLKQRVDEFNDYGELDMMQQYVQDVKAVQKRLADAQEQITYVNKEEVQILGHLIILRCLPHGTWFMIQEYE